MNFEFHPEALEEYQEASRYYAERDPQLARRFIQSVEDAIGRRVEITVWRNGALVDVIAVPRELTESTS